MSPPSYTVLHYAVLNVFHQQDSSICKRVARRELIQTCLKEVATASSLTPDHLTKEFDRLEMAIAKIFSDAESIRLRVLEEKFAKRKCLVKTQVC